MRKFIAPLLLALILAIMAASANMTLANKNTYPQERTPSAVVPVNRDTLMIYRYLTGAWWQWAVGQEKGIVPGLTPDGYRKAEQSGCVWFLAGSFASMTKGEVRDIRIPYGKAIFFPIINQGYIGFPWDANDTPKLAWSIVTPQTDAIDVNKLKCSIDGERVSCLANYRVNSGGAPHRWSFAVDIPPDNPFSPSTRPADFTGLYPTVTDGYWILLYPLSVGKHKVCFVAEDSSGFAINITYYITIVRPLR